MEHALIDAKLFFIHLRYRRAAREDNGQHQGRFRRRNHRRTPYDRSHFREVLKIFKPHSRVTKHLVNMRRANDYSRCEDPSRPAGQAR
ncbi:hypothetical protein [Paracoccus haematequi]|uniref:hypothetical protein n=1 Tax=Paracoccus haematequi TaxID=2491866 RepID=UPI0013E00920|nr:hypothetical protein [Paracoccus haematequi]